MAKKSVNLNNRNVMFNRRNGFVFLDVMLAVAFFSVSIIYIFLAFSQSLRATKRWSSQIKAQSLLEEKMNEITMERLSYSESEEKLAEGTDNKWYWQLTSIGTKVNLDEVTLTVGWEDGKDKGSISILTYLHKKKELEIGN